MFDLWWWLLLLPELDTFAGRMVTSRPGGRDDLVSGEATLAAEDAVVTEAAPVTVGGGWLAACEAMWASNSCSCWRALTNAALRRLVCSALRAFFTLVVTQFSQITLTSLPEIPRW